MTVETKATTDRPSWGRAAAFVGIFFLLYVVCAVVAEFRVGRGAQQSAFQTLLAARGQQVDWIVLGASHALPLAYGDVHQRVEAATGETMLVLAELGAGPVYARFVAQQALQDVRPRRVLYVLDTFAFQAREWNAGRVEDRTLLRTTPLRASTAVRMAGMVVEQGVDPRAMADYLTAFSKLNPPRRFETDGWEGAAAFDRVARPSRDAVASRIDYLYPEGTRMQAAGPALYAFERLIDEMQEADAEVVALRLPLPEHFRTALPDSDALFAALEDIMTARGVRYHDLSEALNDPTLYFDTDHLNRSGVDALWRDYLGDIIKAANPGER